ncbi:hypothetical protein [Shewanella frigidimarina]|uniref:Uncharacterized protein n=1 Tax=Shewanella frigidimarina TaxID=56812 RepID=A0A106BXJ9_SHEFR|nr:hypothetical protein [Shewanella frigidimarina]KVX00450.1 hypothetical protein AWJ07_20680 [Shewanella frigidimarina]
MATEAWDIIDTAVKIGLGALISGVTTYVVTMKTQKHDLKKLALLDKVDLLKSAVNNFEKSSSITDHACASYINYLKGYETKKLEEIIREVTEANNLVKSSRTYLYLIGNKDLGNISEKYSDNLCDLRDAIGRTDKHIYKIGDKLNTNKKDFLDLLPHALDSLNT